MNREPHYLIDLGERWHGKYPDLCAEWDDFENVLHVRARIAKRIASYLEERNKSIGD